MIPATAILFFSRSARAEAAEKAYGMGQDGDQRIAAALIGRTRRTVRRAGLPTFEVDERRQCGRAFGQRLAHAITGVFTEGFERVIVVGNDCPTLTPAHLRRAAAALADGRQVIGADHRGGAWLIGLQRREFDATAFAGLAWQTERLGEDLTNLFGTVTTLGRLRDINRATDLVAQWHQLRARLGGLAWLFASRIPTWSTPRLRPVGPGVRRLRGRAPPVAA